MPRITRAALRSQEGQEEAVNAASVPLPSTPKLKGRAPLGETSGNSVAASHNINTPEESMAAAKKGPGKGKKQNATKKASKPNKIQSEEPIVEVIEDDKQSQTSSAAEEACRSLLEENSEVAHVAVDEEPPHTPLSAAVNEASKQLSPRPTTPRFDSNQQADVTTTSDNKTDIDMQDSSPATVDSHTPTKMDNLEGLGITTPDQAEKEDSFVELIKSRTPGKRVSRIEDSVEALDALDEEIEMVGGLMPRASEAQSPIKIENQTKPSPKSMGPWANGSGSARQKTPRSLKARNSQPTTSVRSAVSRPSMQPPAKRITSNVNHLANQKRATTTRKFVSTSPPSTTSARAPPKLRVSSIYKAPFQPAKSTKPPTRAVFELPGDVVARRLKEQREERLKGDEEKKSEAQPNSKARSGVRLGHGPAVKLNAATTARLSMARGEPGIPAPAATSTGATRKVEPSLQISIAANKRLSTLSVAKRTSNPPSTNSLTTKRAIRTRTPSLTSTASTTLRKSSSISLQTEVSRPAPSGSDLAKQKSKGKEVFGRTRVEILERERARREKDEAVRRARAEAAERGRVASRVWAEGRRGRGVVEVGRGDGGDGGDGVGDGDGVVEG